MDKTVQISTNPTRGIFVVSDPHYDHESIRVHCGRPFSSVEEMNEVMIERHNKMVPPKATVIINGDFAWGRHTHFINALNGKKILVIGNHDRMSKLALEQFTEVIGTPKHPGIYQRPIDGQYCVFCHFPLWSWNASFHGSWHFYGHCHGRKREIEDRRADDDSPVEAPPPRLMEFIDGLSCAVDVDVWDYTPIPWEVLKLKMESRVEAWKAKRDNWRKAAAEFKVGSQEYPDILAAQNRVWRDKLEFKGV